MKKLLIMLVSVALIFTLCACNKKCTEHVDNDSNGMCDNCGAAMPDDNKPCTEHVDADGDKKCDKCGTEMEPAVFDPAVKSDGVMTHAEYIAADENSQVIIEAFVQAKQGWWEKDGQGRATIYLQDTVGGYFVYDLPCSENDYNKMTVGTRLQISGYKKSWSGEVEITDGTFKILDGTYIANNTDATSLLSSADLIDFQNMKVAFRDMEIVASNDAGDVYLYKWDGSGSEGDDLYFKAKVGGNVYTFVIESYLTGKDTDVYKAVKALKVGDVIDMEGFLYWYEGPQPHITSVKVLEGVMTYDQYISADENSEVTITAFVQAKQGWWEKDGQGRATVYLQDYNGAYFVYDLPCSENDYNKMTVGTRLQISGYKKSWSGEVEITDGTFKILEGTYVADCLDATEFLGNDNLIDFQNMKVAFRDMEIVASNDAGDVYLYKWDGSGSEGDDLYFKAKVGGNVYTFVIESYLTGKDTDVYKAVKELKVGDVIDMEGFLYWYEGPQPHIVAIDVVS